MKISFRIKNCFQFALALAHSRSRSLAFDHTAGLNDLVVIGKLLGALVIKAQDMKENCEQISELASRLKIIQLLCIKVEGHTNEMLNECFRALLNALKKIEIFLDEYSSEGSVKKFFASSAHSKSIKKFNTLLTQCVADMTFGLGLNQLLISIPGREAPGGGKEAPGASRSGYRSTGGGKEAPKEESPKGALPGPQLFSPGCLLYPGLTYLFVCESKGCEYADGGYLLYRSMGYGDFRPGEDSLSCPCCSSEDITVTNYILLNCYCKMIYRLEGEKKNRIEEHIALGNPLWINHIDKDLTYEQILFQVSKEGL